METTKNSNQETQPQESNQQDKQAMKTLQEVYEENKKKADEDIKKYEKSMIKLQKFIFPLFEHSFKKVTRWLDVENGKTSQKFEAPLIALALSIWADCGIQIFLDTCKACLPEKAEEIGIRMINQHIFQRGYVLLQIKQAPEAELPKDPLTSKT